MVLVSKLNKKAGMMILIVSNDIFVFTEAGWLKEMDTKLVLGLIEHIDGQIRLLEAM